LLKDNITELQMAVVQIKSARAFIEKTMEKLIDAGGDPDGTLDFYMVHYYDWAKEEYSPFHHPASYWELDKPIVIGEFSAKGPYPGIDARAAYDSLYHNGYAGALSWTWTGHDGHGNLNDAAPGMKYLLNNFPGEICIDYGNSKKDSIP